MDGDHQAQPPRLLLALPDRRDRRHGPGLAQSGRRGDRELAQPRHHARARAARERRAHPRRPRARAGRALRPRPPRPRHLPGRHVRRQPRDHDRPPSATRRCRSRSPTSARCWSRWPIPSNVLAVDDIAIMTGYEVRVAVAPPDDIADADLAPGPPRGRRRRLRRQIGRARCERRRGGRRPARDRRRRAGRQARQPARRPGGRAAAPPTSISPPTGTSCACASASTACCRTSPRSRGAWPPGVISRVKIMAELNIAERRLPQDGRVGLTVDGRHVDLRVVTLPSVHGEAIVMRILDKDSVVVELDKLGMAEPERERFERAFNETHGAVLVTGPTGSGKSTTLYAALQRLNTPEKNIITVEDPVEYEIDGPHPGAGRREGRPHVRRRPARDGARRPRRDHGRRDPRPRDRADRDRVGAHRATSCSRRCTPTTRPSAITRLIEMGIEPFLVASALDCVVAQRLARMLCPQLQAARDHPRRDPARERLQGASSTSRPTSRSAAGAAAAPAIAGASGCMR